VARKIKQLEGKGARAALPHSWRRQCRWDVKQYSMTLQLRASVQEHHS